jgi:hypothetical protein
LVLELILDSFGFIDGLLLRKLELLDLILPDILVMCELVRGFLKLL